MFQEINSIKSRRQRLGIKQNELADLAGVSQSLIAKLEKNKIEPSYSIAIKIFRALENQEHRNEKKCKEIMTPKLISVSQKDKVARASELMKKNAIDQLPVIENKRVVGSISESLIFSKMLEGDKKVLFAMNVGEIMQEPFPIVNADMPVSLVLPMLKAENAIIITENSKFIGIITKTNLL